MNSRAPEVLALGGEPASLPVVLPYPQLAVPSRGDGGSVKVRHDATDDLDSQEPNYLGCHLQKRLSGAIWERVQRCLYVLHRRPSMHSMKRIRQRVMEADAEVAMPRGSPRGDRRPESRAARRGNYFRTGNAAQRFNQVDTYGWRRLRELRVRRQGRNLRAGEADRWTRDYFHNLGLHGLRGTVKYPEIAQSREPERPPVSRVRESRAHGLKGGLDYLSHPPVREE